MIKINSLILNKKNRIIFLFLYIFFLHGVANADEIGIYKTGLAYHIGAGDDNPAYRNAPLGLDKNGAFVYNPGIGIIVDMLNIKTERHEISLVPLAMFFKDCAFLNVWVFGAGPKYRFFFLDQFSFDTELYLSAYVAQEWNWSRDGTAREGKYNPTFMPFYSVGFSYHWKSFCLGIKTTLSPQNDAASSTGGFWIFFTNLYVGIKF